MFLTYLSHFKRGQRNNQLCQKVTHPLLHPPPSSILSRISRRCLIATLLGEKMMASAMWHFRASRTWKPQPAAGACCQIVPATGDRFIGLPCQSVTKGDEEKKEGDSCAKPTHFDDSCLAGQKLHAIHIIRGHTGYII